MAVTFMHEGEEFTSAGTSLPLPASAHGRRGPTVGGGQYIGKAAGGTTGDGQQKVGGQQEKRAHHSQHASDTNTQKVRA